MTYYDLMDYSITLKLRFPVGDLDLPERRGITVVGKKRKNAHRAAYVENKTRVEPT